MQVCLRFDRSRGLAGASATLLTFGHAVQLSRSPAPPHPTASSPAHRSGRQKLLPFQLVPTSGQLGHWGPWTHPQVQPRGVWATRDVPGWRSDSTPLPPTVKNTPRTDVAVRQEYLQPSWMVTYSRFRDTNLHGTSAALVMPIRGPVRYSTGSSPGTSRTSELPVTSSPSWRPVNPIAWVSLPGPSVR